MRKLVLALVLFGGVALFLAICGTGRWADLGLNLVAEAAGISVTIFVIDALLKRDAARRAAPQQICAYHDIHSMVTRMILLYQMIYRVSGRRATTLSELLAEPSYHEYMKRVLLDDPAPVVPAKSWLGFFCGECSDFRSRASQIMLRYSSVLDPAAYKLVHQIHDQTWEPGLLQTVVNEARRNGSRQFSSLDSLLSFPSEWTSCLQELIIWLDLERLRLTDFAAFTEKSVHEEMFGTHDRT
jgi:hypothetical protein